MDIEASIIETYKVWNILKIIKRWWLYWNFNRPNWIRLIKDINGVVVCFQKYAIMNFIIKDAAKKHIESKVFALISKNLTKYKK